ncbi:MAG: AbrB/MazE/SpoVT family DNA-binding domain-containing protein [Nitrososphaerota archaeon]
MPVEEIVQKKYRVTIPAELRKRLRIKEGDKVRVSLEDGRLIIEPYWLVENPTEKLARLGPPKRMVTEPEELEEKIRRGRIQGK